MKIITAVVCFVLAILLTVMLCMYSSEVKFQGIMLEYSVRFLNENPCTFTYVPLYLLFTAGLFALIFWQQACFSSWWGKYIGFGTGGVWGVLNVLELIWGLQFLRDSCKFILIQSISAFQELPLTGTGPRTQTAMLLTRDFSANIGAASWVDPSSTLSSKSQLFWLNLSYATHKLAALNSEPSATTLAAAAPVSSTSSEPMPTPT